MMEFANEILFVSHILFLSQCEPVFTAAKMQAEKDLVGTNTQPWY